MQEPDISHLRMVALSLLSSVEHYRRRTIVGRLLSSLNENPRIKLLRGFRGVGKTTAMLHAFGEHKDSALYFSADNPAIKAQGIYQTCTSALKNGFRILFVDEIHTYPDWRTEIKAFHDEFPSAIIVASGSAPLALVPERREELVSLYQMDMHEYLLLKNNVSLTAKDQWMDKEKSIQFMASSQELIGALSSYSRYGGFPLSLELDGQKSLDAIYYSIRKSIREDSIFFLKMSKDKVFAMENLLIFLATSKPGELSLTSLSSNLHVSKTILYEIIDALSSMEIIRVIRPFASGGALVRADPKMLFFHPNLRVAICSQLGRVPDTGAIREELALFGFAARGWKASTIKGEKKSPDYVIEKHGQKLVVEIGGEGKKRVQLKGFGSGLVVSEYQLVSLLLVGTATKNR